MWHYHTPQPPPSDEPQLFTHPLPETCDDPIDMSHATIRFNDLTPIAQKNFVTHLLATSSYRRLRNMDVESSDEATQTLQEINPCLARSGYSGWGGGNMPRWREKMLSSMIYWTTHCAEREEYREKINSYRNY